MGLKSRRMVPPGGCWSFNNPPKFEGGTFDELLNKVISYRKSRNYTEDQIVSTEFEIEQQICSNWPQGCQQGSFSNMSILEAQRKFKKAVESLDVRGFLSQGEAERRAKICLSCHNHVKNGTYVMPSQGGCETCSKASQILDQTLWQLGLRAVNMVSPLLIKGRSTQYDSQLGQCGLCACLLKIAIWVKNEFGGFKDEKNAFPSFCWKKDNN